MTDGQVVCQFCRMTHPLDAGPSCPTCGAPLDVRTAVSRSGWVEQPPIKDMARIQFGQSRVQVEGAYVPVADFSLAASDWIFFAHHSLLWTEPGVRLGNTSLKGGWNRVMSGLPLIMIEAHGPGRVALSGDRPGEVVALPLMPGRQIWTREHRFLTATGNISYTWEQTGVWYTTGSGDDRETHYPLGQYGDLFMAQQSPGLLLLHAPGNTFLRDLAPGESVLVQPGSLLYRDTSVTAHLHLEYPSGQPAHDLAPPGRPGPGRGVVGLRPHHLAGRHPALPGHRPPVVSQPASSTSRSRAANSAGFPA